MTKDKLTVFCYHDVSEDPSQFSHRYELNVPPNVFEYQMDFIDKNFNVISPDDLINDNIPEKAALITFDDGFKSYFQTAVPIMEKYSFPSINFLNMATIRGEIFFSGLITYLCEMQPDFFDHVSSLCQVNLQKKPLFLYCSKDIVDSYLKKKNISFDNEVKNFVGEFANQKELDLFHSNKLVYFGNHLYNHHVPLLLTNEELIESYMKNQKILNQYPNSRNLFAYPFGQPSTCFEKKQTDLLVKNSVHKIFSAYPIPNVDTDSSYLHRIPLFSYNKSASTIWFSILRKYIYS